MSQTNPNSASTCRTNGKSATPSRLNAGLRYDLQLLDTITTDRNNVSPRVGVAWTPFAAAGTVVRASAGLFYDRIPLRALANALLSAGNTTDVTALAAVRGQPVADAGRRSGVPGDPAGGGARRDAAEPDHDGIAMCRMRTRAR